VASIPHLKTGERAMTAVQHRLFNPHLLRSADRGCYDHPMSPTVFQEKGYRFLFFSLEEERMHVHVTCSEGDAKFWLEPKIELAMPGGLPSHKLSEIRRIIERRKDDIKSAWREHFGR